MKYDIIKTDNYLIIVDDSEIKEGDYRINIQRGYVKLVEETDDYYNQRNDVFKKVIAHLPINNSPILEGVDLLPPLEQEDGIYKLFQEDSFDIAVDDFNTYKSGYNKAKEKYKWTDEDVIKIVEKSRETGLTAEYLLLSLPQPKYPIGFEQGNIVNDKTYTSVTRRNDDFTLWIGKYIWN